MNKVYHQVKYFTTSNETYTYKKMLNENYFKDFFQAMLEEIEFHEKRYHWKLMEGKYLPPGANTSMDIWSFKRKRYPDDSLNKKNPDYVPIVDSKPGVKIIGTHMLR